MCLIAGMIILVYLGYMRMFFIVEINDKEPAELGSTRTLLKSVSSAIPHAVHQIWNTVYVPKSMADYIRTWKKQNPDWDYIFWTHKDMRNLISQVYPEFIKLYDMYTSNIFRADIARYFILFTFGGVYADLDMECLRPLDDIIDDSVCLLSQEPHIHGSMFQHQISPFTSNAFMACRQQHPFFKVLIWNIPKYSGKPLLEATGPIFLDKVARDFLSTLNDSTYPNDRLNIAPSKYFNPTSDGDCRKICETFIARYSALRIKDMVAINRKKFSDCKELARKNFTNLPEDYSYTNHHWVHSYVTNVRHMDLPGSNTLYIKDLVPDVKMASQLFNINDSNIVLRNITYTTDTNVR